MNINKIFFFFLFSSIIVFYNVIAQVSNIAQVNQLNYKDPIPKNAFILNNLDNSRFISIKHHKNIKRNLLMLFNSFEIHTLPLPNVYNIDFIKCMNRFYYSQHSIESRLPYLLTKLTKIASNYYNANSKNEMNIFFFSSFYSLKKLNLDNMELINQLNLINSKKYEKTYDFSIPSLLLNLLTQEDNVYSYPLFKYLDFRYFTSSICTSEKNYENRVAATKFTQNIINYVTIPQYNITDKSSSKIIDFYSMGGHNLIIPASHPLTYRYDTIPKIKDFTRATFLQVDFDLNGHPHKDVIIPYYTFNETGKISKIDMTARTQILENLIKDNNLYFFDSIKNSSLNYYPYISTSNINIRKYEFLFSFLGNDRPPNGYRSLFRKSLTNYINTPNKNENFFFPSKFIDYASFILTFASSEFCIFLPGDTSSSSKLFKFIAIGCIPVIISDNLLLPYEKYIDYSQISIRFPESIVNNIDYLFSSLKSIKEEKKNLMRSKMKEFYQYLFYPDPIDIINPLLNPLSLALVEYIDKKIDYCENINKNNILIDLNSFCDLLLKRKVVAEKFLPLIDF